MGQIDRFDLNKIIEYGATVFLETGTGLGSSLGFALNFGFEKLFSIELIESLYLKAKEKFSEQSRCKLLCDTTINALSSVLNEIAASEKIVYWLDAHFPGADFGLSSYDGTADRNLRIPLESELRRICQLRDVKNDIFIIDDLRIYEDGPFQNGNWPERLKLGGSGIGFVYELLDKTHHIQRDYRDEGYIVCLPREKS